MQLKPSVVVWTAVVVTLALSAATTRGQAARFEPLPNHPNGVDAVAQGVSRVGSTVVGDASTAPVPTPPALFAPREGVYWRNGQITALGDLSGFDVFSTAFAASSDGSVIVGAGNYATTVPNPGGNPPFVTTADNRRAVRWVNGVITPLEAAEAYRPMHAQAVSANGSVIAGYGMVERASPHEEAFRWSNGVTTPLGRVFGTDASRAEGISADGSVIVGDSFRTGNNSSPSVGFRWENGVMTGLSVLPGADGSGANAVSADGRVIVGSSYGLNGQHPVRWDNGVITALTGFDGGWANAVSGDGSVIVGLAYNGPENVTEAFIWDAAHGMRGLKDVLQTDYGLDLTGWSLAEAKGISDDGKTIVGYGTGPGSPGTRAFRVTVPEPGVMSLLLPAALLALRRRRAAR
jgi:probable HAF family extracellular repeat protein